MTKTPVKFTLAQLKNIRSIFDQFIYWLKDNIFGMFLSQNSDDFEGVSLP